MFLGFDSGCPHTQLYTLKLTSEYPFEYIQGIIAIIAGLATEAPLLAREWADLNRQCLTDAHLSPLHHL